MSSKRDLIARWTQQPGLSILQRINERFLQMQMPGHGHSSAEVFALLDDLPYRDEVPNGRDLRGAALSGGVHELDFRECDFSYAPLDMNFVNCDLAASRFDEASNGGVMLITLNQSSFRRAKLRGCYFTNAQALNCRFDNALLSGSWFDGADLSGSSFRMANCKRASFLGANLVGCDFREAILDEAVFRAVRLDKSTDLRGASLINMYNDDQRDVAGNLVAPGTDWRQATYSATTTFGHDPGVMARELLDAAASVLDQRTEPQAISLRSALDDARAQLANKYRPTWYDDILAQFSEADRPFVEQVFAEAMERLL